MTAKEKNSWSSVTTGRQRVSGSRCNISGRKISLKGLTGGERVSIIYRSHFQQYKPPSLLSCEWSCSTVLHDVHLFWSGTPASNITAPSTQYSLFVRSRKCHCQNRWRCFNKHRLKPNYCLSNRKQETVIPVCFHLALVFICYCHI